MIRIEKAVPPEASRRQAYDFYYQQHLDAYRCVRDLEHRLSAYEGGRQDH